MGERVGMLEKRWQQRYPVRMDGRRKLWEHRQGAKCAPCHCCVLALPSVLSCGCLLNTERDEYRMGSEGPGKGRRGCDLCMWPT